MSYTYTSNSEHSAGFLYTFDWFSSSVFESSYLAFFFLAGKYVFTFVSRTGDHVSFCSRFMNMLMMLKEAELPYPSHYFHFRLFGYSAVLRTAGLRVGQFIDGIVVDVSSRVVGAPIAPNNLHDLHSRMRLENGSCVPLLFLLESDSSVVSK